MSPKKKDEKKKNCRMVCSIDDAIETGPDNQSEEELKTTDIATNDKKRTKMIINFKRNLFRVRAYEEEDDKDKKD